MNTLKKLIERGRNLRDVLITNVQPEIDMYSDYLLANYLRELRWVALHTDYLKPREFFVLGGSNHEGTNMRIASEDFIQLLSDSGIYLFLDSMPERNVTDDEFAIATEDDYLLGIQIFNDRETDKIVRNIDRILNTIHCY